MQKKELSHEESLQVIQEMIDMAKNKITETGFHFLLWGILIIATSLAQYMLITNGMTHVSYWVWAIMPIIGAPVALIYEYRRGKKGKTRSKFDKMYGYLWMGFVITLIVSIFVSLSFGINPIAFILLLVGLATFVSGALYRFAPLIFGSFVFWITAAICPQTDVPNQLLINAFAIFIGYIIPGILLWKRYKETKHV
ncbi:MAG: hypothetical protein M0Q38_09205 [Bacteroidales bacterium]|jgi:hypothetical protein|nr:hypothetical protein [Bacteroidales bacterium]